MNIACISISGKLTDITVILSYENRKVKRLIFETKAENENIYYLPTKIAKKTQMFANSGHVEYTVFMNNKTSQTDVFSKYEMIETSCLPMSELRMRLLEARTELFCLKIKDEYCKDDDLTCLLSLKNLRGIDLVACSCLTDAALATLEKFEQLEAIRLVPRKPLSAAAMDHLAANLPRCKMIRKRAPWYSFHVTLVEFLGVLAIIGFLVVPCLTPATSARRAFLEVDKETTDEELAELVRQCPQARFCDLSETTRLTDDGLKCLIQLKCLRTLLLKDCSWLTDKGLSYLSETTADYSLDLSGCDHITLQGLKPFTKPSLPMRFITLPEHLRTDEGFDFLIRLRREIFKVYKLERWHITDKTLEFLAKEGKVIEVELNGGCEKVTEKGIAALATLPEFESLSIRGLSITGLGPLSRGSFCGLRRLEISGCFFLCPESFSGIEHLTMLETLDVTVKSPLDDTAFFSISKLPRLRELSIRATPITDIGLAHLGQCKSLLKLSVTECPKITGTGFDTFASSSLREAIVVNCGMNDEGAIALSQVQCVQFLELSHNEHITDRGIGSIAKMPRLQRLELKSCKGISDTALELLAKSSSLKSLDVSCNPQLTRGAISRFRRCSRYPIRFYGRTSSHR